jgi:hypothetical protein
MSYYHSHLLQLSTCATRKAPETFESAITLKCFWRIEKWLNTIDHVYLVAIFLFLISTISALK